MTNLFLPIETISRELDLRLVLSSLLAAPGRKIFIGDKRIVHGIGGASRGGVYLGKFIFHRLMSGSTDHYLRFKQNQIKMAFLDEEGGIWQGDEDEWRRILATRLKPELFSADELFFTWGEFQRDYYQQRAPALSAQQFVTTGHPRFDLNKPAWNNYFQTEAEKLRERFGQFLLLNTNLTASNHINGYRGAFSKHMDYFDSAGQVNPTFIPYWEVKMKVLASFVSLMHTLSAHLPDQHIVLRPHPSEDQEFYRHALRGLPKVHVIQEGSVAPWLLACQALIHDGCTTSLEAHMAGKQVINYRSAGAEKYEHLLANSVGIRCTAPEQVLSVLGGESAGEPRTDSTGKLSKMLFNMHDDAMQKMVDLLEPLLAQSSSGKTLAAGSLQWRAINRKLEDWGKRLGGRRAKKLRSQTQKFPGFDADYVKAKFAYLQQHLNKDIPYKLYSDTLIVIG